MKNKGLIISIALFILFMALIFATPFMGNENYVWIMFFGFICLILIIWIILSVLNKPEDSVENFKNQPVILQILEIIFIVTILYETATSQSFRIAGFILLLIIIIKFAMWFFKKEE